MALNIDNLIGRLTAEETADLATACLHELTEEARYTVVSSALTKDEKTELMGAWTEEPD